MSRFNNVTASRFVGGAPNAAGVIEHLQSDVSTALELVAEGAVDKWLNLIGPENSVHAKMNAPSTLRAAYGKDSIQNALHGSSNNQ